MHPFFLLPLFFGFAVGAYLSKRYWLIGGTSRKLFGTAAFCAVLAIALPLYLQPDYAVMKKYVLVFAVGLLLAVSWATYHSYTKVIFGRSPIKCGYESLPPDTLVPYGRAVTSGITVFAAFMLLLEIYFT